MTLFYEQEAAEARQLADVVDLFAGPGGWSEGLHQLGHRGDVGLERDRWACATRRAAGHPTVECDVSHVNPADYAGARGLIASPPCQAFSTAGKQHGRLVLEVLTDAIGRGDWACRPHRDPNVWLALEVGRWAEALRPEWIALEQVPGVLPLWQAYARWLEGHGYATWTGILNAADYGVPQVRRRAVLIASTARAAAEPPATHAETPTAELAPWVTMAQALGWVAPASVGFPRLDDVGTSPDGYRVRDWRDVTEPAQAVTEKARSWVLRTGANSMTTGRTPDDVEPYERDVDRPAPTVDRKVGSGWSVNTGRDWKTGGSREDAQTIDPAAGPAPTFTGKSAGQWHDHDDWPHERPSTTLACDPRIFAPGGHIANDGRDNTKMIGRSENTIRITVADALVLQSFRPDYPVRGTQTKQFEQIGNAIPPRLAAAILREVC